MTEQAKAAVKKQIDPTKVLQRVILPRDEDPLDVRPLYIDEPEHVHSHVSSRQAVTIPQSAKVSFASYFNAFPASLLAALDDRRGRGPADLRPWRGTHRRLPLQAQRRHRPPGRHHGP